VVRDNDRFGYYFQKMNIKRTQSGFTFLEVMIAVAVIAIAFVTLIGSQSQSVSVATDSRLKVTASFLAQQKLAELESANFDDLSSSAGDFEDSFSQFHWKTEVDSLTGDEIGIEGADDMLKTVDLTISSGDNEQAIYTVKFIIVKQIVPEGK
jgi:general secretion pathway protein I